MSEETKPWRAEMPRQEIVCGLVWADEVRELVTRANAELDAKDARIAELEKASVVCCKGCPDCLGLGYSPAVLKDAVARARTAEARVAELLAAIGPTGTQPGPLP